MDTRYLSHENAPSAAMPDDYDRARGLLEGAQAVTKTKPSVTHVTPPLGIGGSVSYNVTTYREAGDILDEGGSLRRAPAKFTVFLEIGRGNSLTRVVIPDAIATLIGRQRDALTSQALKRSAKTSAAARKAKGIRPAFLQKHA